MSFKKLSQEMQPAIEDEMQQIVNQLAGEPYTLMRHMLAYHMGWEGEGAGAEARGKRIRPLLVLLTCAAAGGDWSSALPGAAAVELVHNFSLIHDDIEDNSPLRRGRPTVWKRWGIPQAINAGDAMFTQAHLAICRLEQTSGPSVAFEGLKILDQTCLHLTQGQFLDISYQEHSDLSLDDYWRMIAGKTAALLASCTELGALIANVSPAQRKSYRSFGEKLGLAFQVLDDLLGIWGDSLFTGKSVESDLLEGKKTLPILYGLAQRGKFHQRWVQGPISVQEIEDLAAQLESEGAKDYAQKIAGELTTEALDALTASGAQGEAGAALRELTDHLLKRQS